MGEQAERERRLFATLVGLLEGIAIDQQISAKELKGLEAWIDAHAEGLHAPIFAAPLAHLREVIELRELNADQHTALLEFCRDFAAKHVAALGLAASPNFDTQAAFARLQGMALGLLADGQLDDAEIVDLRVWLEGYRNLRAHFVFGAFFDRLDKVLEDGHIDPHERAEIHELCRTFIGPAPPREFPAGFTPGRPRRPHHRPEIPKSAAARWASLPSPQDFDFLALDLETANNQPTSVCAVGVALVHHQELAAGGAALLRPDSAFDPRFVRMHGIRAEQVEEANSFDQLWPQLAALLCRPQGPPQILAHNATFAARCLRELIRKHQLELARPIRMLCTLQLARRTWPRTRGFALHQLAERLSLPDPGHDAQVGAHSCAHLALRILQERGLAQPWQAAAELGLTAIEVGDKP